MPEHTEFDYSSLEQSSIDHQKKLVHKLFSGKAAT
uniref:Uncharacterized protein n=1 Tax=Arundo donax TaxID=35708 RepID=A0A0A9BN38_ARUDO